MSSLTLIAIPFHLLAAYVMKYGFDSLQHTVVNTWISSQKGGHFQFLTIQALSLAFITMSLSLMYDFMPSYTGLKTLKRLFLMVSLPLSVVVSLIYWTLILLLPALIIQKDPSVSEPSAENPLALMRIPLPTDLSLHLVPATAQLLDFLLLEKPFSVKEVRVFAPRMAALFGLWYSIWVEYCASYNGRFPYPFLDHPLPIRIPIYIFVTFLAVGLLNTINTVHVTFISAEAPQQSVSSKKAKTN